ncbi:MAG: prepilin peptidase, partial [Gemmatimonadota bacterium]
MDFDVRIGALLALLAIAASWDVRTRRIPNALTFGGFAVGCLLAPWFGGGAALREAALGGGAGFAAFFGLYLLGAMGAGDVKLMAAAGTFLGWPLVVQGALYSAIAGGVLALVVVLRAQAVRRTVSSLGGLVTFWAYSGRIRKADWLTLRRPDALKVPYGVAIALGCACAVVVRGGS